jgi:glutamyl-tRNA reductase
MTDEILCVGLSHHQTPVALREKVGFDKEKIFHALTALKEKPSIQEGFILSTCNRVELYAHGESGSALRALETFLSDFHQVPFLSLRPHLYRFTGHQAAQQFFRVASSLDSLVLGEAQILGQVKDAISLAREANTLGPHLNLMLNHALSAAKRVRTETQIARHSISISHIAVELIESVFSSIEGRKALLLGAGTMAEVAARCLSQKGAVLHIANRTLENAQELALALSADAHDLTKLDALLAECDIVMTSTNAALHLITPERVQKAMRKRRYRPIFFVDIAVPRNIDPQVAKIDGAYLYNIDDLSQIANKRLLMRNEQGVQADLILEEELERFSAKRQERLVAPHIADLSVRSHDLADAAVDKLLKLREMRLSSEQEMQIRLMAHSLVNKVLHEPIVDIKAQVNKL